LRLRLPGVDREENRETYERAFRRVDKLMGLVSISIESSPLI
jgi:hypothetical protein